MPDRLHRQYRYYQGCTLPQGRINTHNRLSGSRHASRCEDGEESKVEEDKGLIFKMSADCDSRQTALFIIINTSN